MHLPAYLFECGKENIYFLTLGIIGGEQAHVGVQIHGRTCDIMLMPFPWCDIIDQILDVHGRKMVHVRGSGTLMNGEKWKVSRMPARFAWKAGRMRPVAD